MDKTNPAVTRRHFIASAAGGALSLSIAKNVSAHGRAINAVRVGQPTNVPNNFGDTWNAAWADDDNLYTPSDDTLGFDIPDFLSDKEQLKLFQSDGASFFKNLTADQRSRFEGQFGPIAFNRVEGTDPLNMHGVTVNRVHDFAMQDGLQSSSDAMLVGQQPRTPAPDGRSWKSSGCAFIDGTLYWVIARHKYPENSEVKGLRQSAANASIIKSTDYGKTWTRSAKENYDSPMFPGSNFATPYLVDYGKNHGSVDGADKYVYAISNNGYWDNGDTLILGRVSRTRIGLLNGSDWEYFAGGDGRANSNWTRDSKGAKPIIDKPGKLGMTGAVYLPARQRYIMVGWYYPAGSGYLKGASTTTVWDFYEASSPWGPWSCIGSHTWSPQGYYTPGICPKFQSGSRVYALTAGDFNNWWDYYRLTVVPIELL